MFMDVTYEMSVCVRYLIIQKCGIFPSLFPHSLYPDHAILVRSAHVFGCFPPLERFPVLLNAAEYVRHKPKAVDEMCYLAEMPLFFIFSCTTLSGYCRYSSSIFPWNPSKSRRETGRELGLSGGLLTSVIDF